LPVVAIVGRPNVGKSTLVNRFIGRREAVVEDVPGVTRDRVAYDAQWAGRRFTVLDTGGWQRDARGMAGRIAEQAEIAVLAADAVVLVVDTTVGVTDADEAVARVLQRSGKPVVVAANKVDNPQAAAQAAEIWSLGLGEPMAVSALHGTGSGDLLDAVVRRLPEQSAATDDEGGPRRVALVGRPNVGKSSLLNQLSGQERALVDAVAGTTRDPVDSLVELGEQTWRFVDTAGLRRRVKEAKGAEYYSSLRTSAAIEAAEVAIVLLDASEPISEQDQRVISMVIEAGRALVLAFNKWDLVDEDRRYALEREVERELLRVPWAPRVNISARTGRSVQKLAPALRQALDTWETRVPTAELNALFGDVIAATPPPVRGGKQPRVLFATQPGVAPPRFVLFTSGPLEAGYRRFIERRLRERYGFVGTPLDISVKAREKRKR
jgi:GTP-binding protein